MKTWVQMAAVTAGMTALMSCDQQTHAVVDTPPSGFADLSGGKYDDKDFSEWMTKADQQMIYDKRAEGTYFAYTEGRSNGGLHQYRHVLKEIPKETTSEWGVYWGLDSKEFFQVDLKLQKSGFKRESLQVFEDGDGAAYHQAVWLKAK
ncbi:MAG: hypothetical protein ABJQ29_14695 [Luteolibacter sp.]